MSDMIAIVTKAVRNAREMSLCSLCDSHHRRTIRCSCEEIARAAIEAMRAISVKMTIAGRNSLQSSGLDDAVMYDATRCFNAMIDAALSQSPNSLPSEDR